MNSILRLMIGRLMHADPDVAGGASGAEAETEAPSMDSTLKSLFDKIQAEGKVDAAGTLVDTEADTTDEAAKRGRARDATCKFAKTAAEVADDDTTGRDAVKPAVAAVETPAAVETKFAEAPKSWNAAERAAWTAMPEAARAAAHRREENFFQGIEQYKGKAATFDQLDAVIRPHAEIFQQTGQTAIENVHALLNLQQVLYRGDEQTKLGTLLQIVEQSGIKAEVLIQGLQNPQARPVQDPRYDSLARELQQTRAMIQESQFKPVLSQTEAFLADPKNEHVSEPEVTAGMEMLLKSGAAKTLQEAYDKACRLSDSVQAKVSAGKAEAERKAQAERDAAEAKRKADLVAKATKASSINVKPRGATAGPATKGTMDDTIGAAWDRIHGSGN